MGIAKQKNVKMSIDNSPTKNIYDSVLQTIGNTPLVKMNGLMKKYHSSASILAKLEYFNPMSSTKDRPAFAMIEALMALDEFNSDTQIIEATSGNNGVSCAWICAMYKIPLTIVIPEHMSIERQKMIKHFGAKIITTAKQLGTKGAIDMARELVANEPNAISLDQFGNQSNPDAHAASTAMEILRDSAGEVDIFVAGVGTGGSISGIGGALKDFNSSIKVVAVEPQGCPILSQGIKGVHAIQGLSSGHIPDILDQSVIDDIQTVSDEDAINMARELAKVEGMPVGISSGATVTAALRLSLMPENKDKNIVVILADTAERYYSTELFIS
ncbi:MAG: cysteine synthase A [Glaciecola sp.]|jgi:cysteine synthase A